MKSGEDERLATASQPLLRLWLSVCWLVFFFLFHGEQNANGLNPRIKMANP